MRARSHLTLVARADDALGDRSVAPGHPGIADRQRARAYAGEAHGTTWLVFGADGPTATVELPTASRWTPYRILWRPRTGLPARDSQGSYVYVRELSADERAERDAALTAVAAGFGGSAP